MRITNIILNLVSLLLVAAGLALIGTFFFPSAFLQAAQNEDVAGTPQKFDVPVLSETAAHSPESTGFAGAGKEEKPALEVPVDKTLSLTIPKMSRVQNAVIPDAAGDAEEVLRNNTAIHLEGTGFPWQQEANVYIAGHRLGYPNSTSFLAFYDLNVLQKGDRVFISDSLGRRYVYEVYEVFVVGPTDVYITQPVEGRNIVTLQTCTLPDYSQRLIVRAEEVA